MDEEHRAAAERLWAEADRRARERGVTEPELTEKRRQFFELLDEEGGDAAVDRLQGEWPEIASRTTASPPRDVNELLGLRRGQLDPIPWLAEHRPVVYGAFVALVGALGYFGALGRAGPQPVRPGIAGLAYGLALAAVAIVVVTVWTRLRGPRARE